MASGLQGRRGIVVVMPVTHRTFEWRGAGMG